MSLKDSARDESDREASKYFNPAFMVLGYHSNVLFPVIHLMTVDMIQLRNRD